MSEDRLKLEPSWKARVGDWFQRDDMQALSAFLRMGQAYLRFASEKPGFYMAMFESGLSIAGNADLAAAIEAAETFVAEGRHR